MRARALALAALTSVLPRCTPSEDLASYSSGTGSGGGGALADDPAGDSPGAGVGGASSEAPAGDVGSGGSEAGNLPEVIQGGSAGSTSNSPGAGAGDPPASVGSEGEPGALPVAEDPGETPADAPPQFRFVRLVADSAIGQGPLTSIAEFNVLDSDGEAVDRSGWVVTADSEELVYVGGAQAQFAIDGDESTMWHTAWFEVEPPSHPHSIEVDMGQARAVGGFRYLPRQDAAVDGRIDEYRFFVSVDGVDWGEPVVEGEFPADTEAEQTVLLTP